MNLFQFAACGQTRADYRLSSPQSNRVPPENAAGAPVKSVSDRSTRNNCRQPAVGYAYWRGGRDEVVHTCAALALEGGRDP
jgi:hypothetical protein